MRLPICSRISSRATSGASVNPECRAVPIKSPTIRSSSLIRRLGSETLTPSGRKVEFPIDAFSKHCLLEGVDELGYILKHEPYIAAYEARRVGSINTLG